jgi:hypothetical protein
VLTFPIASNLLLFLPLVSELISKLEDEEDVAVAVLKNNETSVGQVEGVVVVGSVPQV